MNVFAQLVRLPAALSAPGDPILGAIRSCRNSPVEIVGAASSSTLIYLSGMALNDYADRDIDAVERPNRPIPSGAISASRAGAIGAALMAGGVATAAITGGKHAAARAALVSSAVLTYNFGLKATPFAPLSMATCRFFSVLSGASNPIPAAIPAAIIAGHTMTTTTVSRFEVEGGNTTVAKVSKLATIGFAAVSVLVALKTAKRSPLAAITSVASTAVYAVPVVQAALAAEKAPTPANLQHCVGAGVKGMIPLQGSLISSTGTTASTLIGSAVTSLWPIAQHLTKRRRVT